MSKVHRHWRDSGQLEQANQKKNSVLYSILHSAYIQYEILQRTVDRHPGPSKGGKVHVCK